MGKRGLFIGLITGDLLYRADHPPGVNEKVVATEYCFTAGGPATNGAIAFQVQGGQASLMAALGQSTLGTLLAQELKNYQVTLIDVQSNPEQRPPISSIIVTEATGDRSVISLNAQGVSSAYPIEKMRFLHKFDVVLVDGHLMSPGAAIAPLAQAQNIPVVVDGGSWKPHFDRVLRHTDFAICSENFYPPECHTSEEVMTYLKRLGVAAIAITRGEKPILWWQGEHSGEIPVPQTKVVDTLGAGDIFHGAFCYHILDQDFPTALAAAAEVASYSCQFFGTRAWTGIS